MWAWEHLYVARPDRPPPLPQDQTAPLGARWKAPYGHKRNPAPHMLQFYRDQLDQQREIHVSI